MPPTKRKPEAALKKILAPLLTAAAAGKANLSWLDKAVRKAGYLAAGEVPSRQEIVAATHAIVEALVDSETTAQSPCCRECLHRAIKQLRALVAGR